MIFFLRLGPCPFTPAALSMLQKGGNLSRRGSPTREAGRNTPKNGHGGGEPLFSPRFFLTVTDFLGRVIGQARWGLTRFVHPAQNP